MDFKLHQALQRTGWASGCLLDASFYADHHIDPREPLIRARDYLQGALAKMAEYEASLPQKETVSEAAE